MKRIYSRIPYILSILSLAVNCQLLTVNSLQAQVQSAAFDPQCYQPIIGTRGVVDTIYGTYSNESLGGIVENIWHMPGDPYGRIVFANDTGIANFVYPIFTTGPKFDLHHLNIIDTFPIAVPGDPSSNWPGYIVKRTHFRSAKYLDILYKVPGFPPRIFWANDQGRYDSARYTELRSPILSASDNIYYDLIDGNNFYVTPLSNDSVCDIIFEVDHYVNLPIKRDSIYFLLFKGGNFSKDSVAYADSLIFLDTVGSNRMRFTQGDFRGSGRVDLISANENGDVFYYKNDLPFSMTKFINAMKFDSIMTAWQNPHYGSSFRQNSFTMRAFNKKSEDSSVDFMPVINGQIYIFRGSPEFGTHRIFKDSADFVIHHPSYYDNQWTYLNFGTVLYDCGDMTGSGNRVLFVGGDEDADLYGYFFFYVLGDAMDDKVDMYFEMDGHGFVNAIDTLVADGDALQDIILGIPDYVSPVDHDNGDQTRGTIWVIHGSMNIPVHISGVTASPQIDENIHMYPNPVTNKNCTIDFGDTPPQDIELAIFDLLGRKVYGVHIYAPFFRKSLPVFIPFASGSYIVEITGKNFTKRIQLTVLK